MTDQERINIDLQRQIDAQNSRIDNVLTKVDGLIQGFQDFKTEMRQQNQMRANELRDLQKRHDEEQRKRDEEQRKHDAEFKEFQKKHEDNMRDMNKRIDDKFDKLSDQIHTMTIAAVVGFGAIAAAVFTMVPRSYEKS